MWILNIFLTNIYANIHLYWFLWYRYVRIFVRTVFLIPIYTDIFVRIDIDTNVTLWFPYKYPYLLPNLLGFTAEQQKQTLNTQTISQNFRQAELYYKTTQLKDTLKLEPLESLQCTTVESLINFKCLTKTSSSAWWIWLSRRCRLQECVAWEILTSCLVCGSASAPRSL